MNPDAADIQYLTVDSIQWATSEDRPRMTKEDKRAKHRVHQRHFVLRQRERLAQLRREVRWQHLQLKRLQAAQEAATLKCENDVLQQQLNALSSPTNAQNLLVDSDASPQVDVDESVIFEMLTALPERMASVVELEDVWSLPRTEGQDLAPQAWSPTTPCEFPIWSISPEFY
jgi:hypothetical protein